MLLWILARAKERSTWMGLFSLAGACRLNHQDRRHGRTARLALLRHQPADLLCRARHRRSGHRARLLASG